MEQTNATAATVPTEVEQLRQRLQLLQNTLQEGRNAEYEQVLDRTGIAIQRIGPDGTILWASQGQLDLTGYSRDEYLGRNIADFYGVSLSDTPDREQEATVRCKNGAIRNVIVTGTNLMNGTEQGCDTLVMRDVTEQRRSELRLAVQFGASQLLPGYPTMAEAAPAVLKLIGESLEFECGAFWVPAGAGELRCHAVWQREPPRLAGFSHFPHAYSVIRYSRHSFSHFPPRRS